MRQGGFLALPPDMCGLCTCSLLALLVNGVAFVVCTSASPASLGTSLLTFSLDLEGHLLHRTWVHSDLSPQAVPTSP